MNNSEETAPTATPGRKSSRLAAFYAFAALIAIAFFQPISSLVHYSLEEDLHSYTLLIPAISVWLVTLRRDRLPKVYLTSWSWGITFAVVGAAFLIWGNSLSTSPQGGASMLTGQILALVSLLIAGGFLILGFPWMRAVAFPAAFLFFTAPLTPNAVDTLERASQVASAEAAYHFFNLSGTAIMREGLIFHLSNITIEVAQECSGIRSSLVLFITSLVAANLFLKSPWRRVLLVSIVIPLGIIRNGFRILVIGTLCIRIGPHMIHSIIHKRGGPLFFLLSLVPLFVLLWWLRRGEPRQSHR